MGRPCATELLDSKFESSNAVAHGLPMRHIFFFVFFFLFLILLGKSIFPLVFLSYYSHFFDVVCKSYARYKIFFHLLQKSSKFIFQNFYTY